MQVGSFSPCGHLPNPAFGGVLLRGLAYASREVLFGRKIFADLCPFSRSIYTEATTLVRASETGGLIAKTC